MIKSEKNQKTFDSYQNDDYIYGNPACCAGGLLAAQSFLPASYYMNNKEKVLVEAFDYLNDASGGGNLEADDFVQELSNLCETNNISLYVMGSDGQGILSTVRDSGVLQRRLYMYLFAQDNTSNDIVMQETQNFSIHVSADYFTDIEYLEIIGFLQGEKHLWRELLWSRSGRAWNLPTGFSRR